MSDLARKLAEAVAERDELREQLEYVRSRGRAAVEQAVNSGLREMIATSERDHAELDVTRLIDRCTTAERRLEHIAELHEGLDWCDECECFHPCPTRRIATEGSDDAAG